MDLIKKYWTEIALCILTSGGLLSIVAGFDSVIRLTPMYLTLNLALLIARYKSNQLLFPMLLLAASVGFVAEFIGVQTGLLFGDYVYGSVLGPKVFDVPLMVGVMWALVMIVVWALIPKEWGLKRIPVAGFIAVLYDLVLEHFATRFDLWTWEGSIPLSNYIGWFIVASSIAAVYHYKGYALKPTVLTKIMFPLHILFFIAAIL